MYSHTETLTESQKRMLEEAHVTFPAQLPIFDSPPDIDAMNEWIACQPSLELQSYARKLTENINYITFEQFINQLKITISDFNQNHPEPYVLCISQRRSGLLDKLQMSSDPWVIALAFEYANLRWPEAILTIDELKSYLKSHSDVKKVLLLDDAAYSGTHMSTEISFITRLASQEDESIIKQIDLIFGIPFITNYAKKIILSYRHAKTCTFLTHDSIPVISEIFTKENELQRFIEITKIEANVRHTVTYFAHKFPDWMSTLQQLQTGHSLISMERYKELTGHYYGTRPINCTRDADEIMCEHQPRSRPIVPYIAPPYSYHRRNNMDNLLEAIANGNIGTRNSNPLPDFLINHFSSETQPLTVVESYTSKSSWNKAPTLSHEDYRRYKVQQWLCNDTSFEALIEKIKMGDIRVCGVLADFLHAREHIAAHRLLHATNLPSESIWPDHFALYYLLNSAYSWARGDNTSHYNHFDAIFTSPFWIEQESAQRQQLKHAIFINFLYKSSHEILTFILPYAIPTDFFQILQEVDDTGVMTPRSVNNILEAQLLYKDNLSYLPDRITIILANKLCTTELLLYPGADGHSFLSKLFMQLNDESNIDHHTELEQTVQIVISSQHCTSDVIEKALKDADLSFEKMMYQNADWMNIILSSTKYPNSCLPNDKLQNNAGFEKLNIYNTSRLQLDTDQPILDIEPSQALNRLPINHITMHVLNGFLMALGITAIAVAFTVLASPTMSAAGIAVTCIGGISLILGGYGLFKSTVSVHSTNIDHGFQSVFSTN